MALHCMASVWPEENRQMSIKVAPKWFQLKNDILTPLQKMPKNVGDLGKFIVAKGFKKLPKVQKIAQSGHTAWHAVHTSSSKMSQKIMIAISIIFNHLSSAAIFSCFTLPVLISLYYRKPVSYLLNNLTKGPRNWGLLPPPPSFR